MSAAVFSDAQPFYAEHGIATFPVKPDKTPAVRGFLRTGLKGSKDLATKFGNAAALGFVTNERNGLTVLDIDTPDERVLEDALDRHGRTPLIARTGSGKFHAYYRHNNERRRIRPWPGREIDLLGRGGYVVAPPSQVTKGSYVFIDGTLADVHCLPVLRNLDLAKAEGAKQGARNNSLWRHCMKNALHVDEFDELLDVARTFNENCEPPMEDSEVISAARSAWEKTERGQNRFGQHGAWLPLDEVNRMIDDQDAFLLLAFLRAHQGPEATFMCANGLTERFGWRRQRLSEARDRLIELGYLKRVRHAGRGHAARFRWSRPSMNT
jgi:Bifunctional DNA primase/polymerase, N-terminal/Primase C terminal 1 (PriCT-1)